MEKYAVICCRLWARSRGFLLAELQMSLAMGAVLALLTCTAAVRCSNNYLYLREQARLQEAGWYMLSHLEKELAYNARSLRLANNEITYTGPLGNKKITIYYNKNGLYRRTTTGSGTGVNPLFLEGLVVHNWQVRSVSPRLLALSFTLQGKKYSRSFSQLFICHNGSITDAG